MSFELYLHGADAQAPVDDKLAEGRRALVAVSAVDHEETAQMFELSHREVSGQRGLLSFLPNTKKGTGGPEDELREAFTDLR